MQQLIKQLSEQCKPSYITNYENFTVGKNTVLYSGPYWDSEELYAILNNVLTGNWIVSGNAVEKFQEEFSQKFKVKYSHMVNSGSSANLVIAMCQS